MMKLFRSNQQNLFLKNRTTVIILVLLFSIPIIAQTYITNVNIADVENQKILPNQTIVIIDDIITTIKSSKKVKSPENANIIDGTGKYIFPGLTDAHIHFFQNGGLYTRPDAMDLRKFMPHEKDISYAHNNMENVLQRYLQNGITNVIDVGSNKKFLLQREDFKDKLNMPSIYMTGPLLTTYQPNAYENLEDENPFSLVKSVEDGIKMVKDQLLYKPDFIKIWYITTSDGLGIEASARKNLPIIKAIIDEAHKHNLRVAVHATQRIPAQLAVENGCDFLVHSIDDEIVKDDFVQLLKKNQTFLSPTLTVSQGYMDTFGQRIKKSDYELLKADPYQLGSLLDLKHLNDTLRINMYKNMANSKERVAALNKADSISFINLKLLSDAGVNIATGTDSGNIGTLHASSYLAELKAMSKSGMSNWQIMRASTINGAKVLDKEHEFGTVAVGKKANLILLDANPIDNIENVTKLNLVINNGKSFNPNDLIKDSPEDLAQRQLNAYNLRNIDAFLEPYADDVEVYNYPDTLLFKGKETMRTGYSQMFDNTPNLHCELVGRISQGNVVMDKERVQMGDDIVEAIAIYHIQNNKIKKVFFVR